MQLSFPSEEKSSYYRIYSSILCTLDSSKNKERNIPWGIQTGLEILLLNTDVTDVWWELEIRIKYST